MNTHFTGTFYIVFLFARVDVDIVNMVAKQLDFKQVILACFVQMSLVKVF